jgi:acyl-CoA reductase-like NAD-dependent aldehyde dehydrogenase
VASSFALSLRSLINGVPVSEGSTATFSPTDPTTGLTLESFAEATANDVDAALAAALAAAPVLAATNPAERSELLNEIARQLELVRDAIVERGERETGISAARLTGELSRTTNQLRAFAGFVATGDHQARVFDTLPEGSPARDLRRMALPLGVVVVFEASNFPLAFGTAGGDTAAALAAGCPVVAKAHPSHPGTSEIVALALSAALATVGLPAGVFSLLQGSTAELSRLLVMHPDTAAVGFTGSQRVGRILMDLAASREHPILVHAEMGSTNPLFVTSAALTERGDAIAAGLVGSIMIGSGQLCTKPGLIFVPAGVAGDSFVGALAAEFATQTPIPLLNAGVRSQYVAAGTAREPHASLTVLATTALGAGAVPVHGELVEVSWADARGDARLLEERFGPAAVVVRLAEAEFAAAASELENQLTFTIQGEVADHVSLQPLVNVLARKAGRVVWNGFPTGVAVSPAMTHGGLYPASSTATTSVGLAAIDRFLRPVTFQDFPAELLPSALVEIH